MNIRIIFALIIIFNFSSACSNKKVTVIKVKSHKKITYNKIGKDSKDCLSMNQDECEAFNQTNNLRLNNGVNPLIAVENCIEAARYHSQQMKSNNMLSHDGRIETWAKRVQRFGAIGKQMAENIALASTPGRAIQKLIESPEHKANILNPVFTHIGIGHNERYWTQCFLEI